MQASKKRLRSHASDEKAAKSRKVGRGRGAPEEEPAAAPAAADAAASEAEQGGAQAQQRGYKAVYHWEHYNFADLENADMVSESELLPSIPSIFSSVLVELRDAEYARRDRRILRDGGLDRRIVRPYDGRSKSGPVIQGAGKEGQFQVTACRRDHVMLIYQREEGLLQQLGLCPHLLEIFLVNPGRSPTAVGGRSHDSRLKCCCDELRAAWDEEEAARTKAGEPTEAERAAGRDALAAGDGDGGADGKDGGADGEDEDADEDAAAASSDGGGDRDEAAAGSESGAGGAAGDEGDAASQGSSSRRSSRGGSSSASRKKRGSAAAAAASAEDPAAASAAAAGAAVAALEAAFEAEEPDAHMSEDEGPVDLESTKDTALTVGEIWDSLEAQLGSVRKAVEKSWRLRLKQSEREKDDLRTALVEAQERAEELEQRWKAEKDTNVKLWNQIETINKTIDRMVRPAGGRK